MTPEEKQLLIQDLCMRLPYGIKLHQVSQPDTAFELYSIDTNSLNVMFWKYKGKSLKIGDCGKLIRYGELRYKPYLRPMESMTEEEGERLEQIAKETLGDFMFEAEEDGGAIYHMDKWKTLSPAMFDYLNSIHIDYRGLIEMGLALEAPEGMYKTN